MKKLFFLFLISSCIISCSDKKKIPKDILPEEKMRDVLWSMVNAGEFLNAYVLNKDSIDKVAESTKVYGQVFQVHGVTKEQFDKSYAWYREHPGLMKTILDSLSKKPNPRLLPVQDNTDSLRKKLIKPVEAELQ